MTFHNRVAVITGAGSKRGIGRAAAEQLTASGANVILLDINQNELEEVSQELGDIYQGMVFREVLDITDRQSVIRVMKSIHDKFGRIDILINSAGVTYPTRVMDITPEEWERVLKINLTGFFNTTQEVLKYMKQRSYGRIVNLSSIAGKRGGGSFGGAHYAASKAGVAGFTKAVAREMAGYNITANCVSPGVIDTDITGDLLTEELEQKRMAGIPMSRKGSAMEVGAAILFLASEESSYITGEDMDVNGGLHID